MFSGIIEELGVLKLKEIIGNSRMVRLVIEAKIPLDELKIGDSIAVNGTCLTLLEVNGREFLTEASPETIALTNLELLSVGDRVNLERAMKASDRFNGHIMSGHVDGKVRRLLVERVKDGAIAWFELSEDFRKYIVSKGSVALNGVSLTVNQILDDRFSVFLIPHTLKETNLLDTSSAWVNLEVDLMGKYIEKFVSNYLVEGLYDQ